MLATLRERGLPTQPSTAHYTTPTGWPIYSDPDAFVHIIGVLLAAWADPATRGEPVPINAELDTRDTWAIQRRIVTLRRAGWNISGQQGHCGYWLDAEPWGKLGRFRDLDHILADVLCEDLRGHDTQVDGQMALIDDGGQG